MTTELTANHILVGNHYFNDIIKKNENDCFVLIIRPSDNEKGNMSIKYPYSGIYNIIKKSNTMINCNFIPFDYESIEYINLFKNKKNLYEKISTLKFDKSKSTNVSIDYDIKRYELIFMFNTGEPYKFNFIRIREFNSYSVYDNKLNNMTYNDVISENKVCIYVKSNLEFETMTDIYISKILNNKIQLNTSIEGLLYIYTSIRHIVRSIDGYDVEQEDNIKYIIETSSLINDKFKIGNNIYYRIIFELFEYQLENYGGFGYWKIKTRFQKIMNLSEITLQKKIFDVLSNEILYT